MIDWLEGVITLTASLFKVEPFSYISASVVVLIFVGMIHKTRKP